MSAREIRCLVIECDVCGDGAEYADDGFTPHFDTIEDATKTLGGDDDTDWIISAAEHVCPNCRAKRACATVGHNWGDWWAGDARGIPMRRRVCWRCQEDQVAPAGDPR